MFMFISNLQMVRVYKKKLGTRSYKNYENKKLEQAITSIVEGRLSIRAASRTYKVPYGTLNNKFHGRHCLDPGGRTVFSKNEETAFVNAIIKCSDWGFPLTEKDLKIFVKSYLDGKGINEPKFADNLPGDDWVKLFLKRHNRTLGPRWAANIKKSRAAVTKTIVSEYFDNLRITVDGIEPTHLFNYDETNVSDDPGKIKAIFRKGVKYPERVMNHSKSSTSVMMCGSASGDLLPPYIIYKGEHLWNTWKEGGPKGLPCCTQPCCSAGSRYARTKHGWIDSETFSDWFESSFLPHARRLNGKKVLLGDNLASHLNANVVRLCEENDIVFTCLPPNSTHLLQPLDVAFFRPFKSAWRSILTAWKLKNPKNNCVPKEQFPYLLRSALEKMDSVKGKQDEAEPNAIKRILAKGFEATGIYPFSPQKVLQKLPDNIDNNNLEETVNDTLTDFLRSQRESGQAFARRNKRKKLRVEPGKSIVADTSSESSTDIELDDSNGSPNQEDVISESDEKINDVDDQDINEDNNFPIPENIDLEVGKYVLVKFPGKGKRNVSTYIYVCRIDKLLDYDEMEVQGLRSSMNNDVQKFRPVEGDLSIVPKHDVVRVLPTPKKEGTANRPEFSFPFKIDVKEY